MPPQKIIPLDRTSAAVWLVATTTGATWRYHITGEGASLLSDTPPSPAGICCFWHEYLLAGFHFFRRRGATALISASRDGERLSAVLQRWGYDLVRGSSSRKAVSSLRHSIRVLTQGRRLLITPDGPRGPRRVLKPGIAQIARSAQVPIIPITISIHPHLRLRSWDRFAIPLPFSRITLAVGAPIPPAQKGDTDELAPVLKAVEEGLNQ